MAVPAYYRSRYGRVFRVQRVREETGDRRARYVLRAFAVPAESSPADPSAAIAETAREISADDALDRVRHHQGVPTPEQTFEELWQPLRLRLDTVSLGQPGET